MTFVATTISEYYIHEAELKAEEKFENKIKSVEKKAENKIKTEKKRAELIGKIQVVQEVLKIPVTPKNKLEPQKLKELDQIFKQLKSKLK